MLADIAEMYARRDARDGRPYKMPDGAVGVPSACRAYFTAYLMAPKAVIYEDVASILLDVRLER